VFAGETGRCRSSSADISADAEISASGAAGDAELFSFGLERRPFHAEAGRGAYRCKLLRTERLTLNRAGHGVLTLKTPIEIGYHAYRDVAAGIHATPGRTRPAPKAPLI